MAHSCPNAPFRKYNKTDGMITVEGIKSGLEWKAHWTGKPGGPWVPQAESYYNVCPDWLAHCETLKRHRTLWLKGWEEGNALRLQNQAMAEKMAGLIPA